MFHLAFIVTAVQARRHIRAHGGKRFSRYNLLADGSLDGHFEELPRDDFI